MNDNDELYQGPFSFINTDSDTGDKHYPAAVLCRRCRKKIFVLSDETAGYHLCESCLLNREALHGHHRSVDSEHRSPQTG